MEALRAHPFFASIRWDTLWDDPAPPLETGLVRREAAPADEWDDVGAAWDELVSGPDGSEDEDEDDESVEGSHLNGNSYAHARSRAPGDDGIEWAPDAQVFVSPAIPPEEIGPHGEMPDYARVSLSLAEAGDAAVATDGDVEGARVELTGADGLVNGSYGIAFTPPRVDGVSTVTVTGAGEDVGRVGIGLDPGSGPPPGPSSGPGPGSSSPGPSKDNDAERDSSVSTSAERGKGGGDLVAAATAASRQVPKRTSAPRSVPRGIRDSYATSSSDGSPVEKLGAALEAMGIHRGRLRTRSPTPARDAPSSADAPDWYVPLSTFTLGRPVTTFGGTQGIGTRRG